MEPIIQTQDLELGKVRDGYPSLAKWIAQDLDDDALVFREFGRLSARCILYLQCRLVALEAELDDLDEKARSAKELGTRQSLQRWETLIKNAKSNHGVEKLLVEKTEEFLEALKEYYEILTLRSYIAQLSRPSDRVLAAYDDFLKGIALGAADKAPMPLIHGRASKFLEDKADLVALQKPNDDDYLSSLLQDHWPFKERKTTDPLDRTTVYKNSHVVRTVAGLNMIIAAILLIGAIVHLYSVKNPKAKLGFVAMYTVLFALSMLLFTNARRAEIFAAVATYAAVLVVFVSGDLGNDNV